jgi:ABC-2 type transport system ATP-binding protein
VGTTAIRTEGLSKRYGKVDVLKDLDLEVAQGEVLGYLGPNGAGKTTTMRLLLGLIRPSSGRGEIFGLDCQRQAVEAHQNLAYVPGEATLWPSLTGAETLHLLGRVQGRVDDAYRDELIERFALDLSKKVRAYSKGNRQKLILIAALMTRPKLLVLDEPTSGLDPLMEQTFRHCIHEAKERHQTVFLSSHLLSEVEALCDRVGILRGGVLVEIGTLAEMRHLSALTVEATFEGAIPDLSRVPGVSLVEAVGRVVRCQVRGSVEPLLKVLATSGVRELLSREPSLEETVSLSLRGGRRGRQDQRIRRGTGECRLIGFWTGALRFRHHRLRRRHAGRAPSSPSRQRGRLCGPGSCGATSLLSTWPRRHLGTRRPTPRPLIERASPPRSAPTAARVPSSARLIRSRPSPATPPGSAPACSASSEPCGDC